MTRSISTDDYVLSVAWDPEGTYLAVVQHAGGLLLYDTVEGRVDKRLEAMCQRVGACMCAAPRTMLCLLIITVCAMTARGTICACAMCGRGPAADCAATAWCRSTTQRSVTLHDGVRRRHSGVRFSGQDA